MRGCCLKCSKIAKIGDEKVDSGLRWHSVIDFDFFCVWLIIDKGCWIDCVGYWNIESFQIDHLFLMSWDRLWL